MDETLAERMKALETAEVGRRLAPGTVAVARVDGRSFSRYTRDLTRPFDPRLSRLMIETAQALVHETGAVTGYTQSDEITLVMVPASADAQIYFDGRIQKMTSQLGAQATAIFNHLLPDHLPEKASARSLRGLPTFDARVWSVPTHEDALDVLRWRQMDGVRNSVLMAAHTALGHRAMQDMSVRVLRGVLRDRGSPWEDLPAYFKMGTFLCRTTVQRRFTADELSVLPPQHEARRNPDLVVERTELTHRALPMLDTVANLHDVVFHGASPEDQAPATDALST